MELCLQPPPTTITLGAIMDDRYYRMGGSNETMYWGKGEQMLWKKEACGSLCGDVYGRDQ